ncbi:MAG: hypothetical protein A3J48_04185 [Candidatus Doudnabacteria bacterium RIFCSPHIGHO2_02_FULL_46_11]|uniref:O-antigen ligase-related domain-containing protein n=3 Tax=Bacteria candidate phyla TaxID=1783234 RepID=A0A1F5P8N5_9BACT|nr:MAG: hypothetical protein A3E73_01380 [Candidatus Beckwithbacteria bacterium RIFCSPHIGHO2_12_FULL_47_17]OGD57954.1 MAG: hypothetical protein A3I57_00135 [Candidatus Beckwithbacteria bacterium RIFCSPLOWO2_02_FULL_47_23]OGE86311.1 MAG: hypothetical protein A3J48_04185 [Candidatus Doudnabacteria bacterium RIFCSPHIGHO2_02_FULL_46_11]
MNNLLVLVLFGSMIFGEFQRLPGLPLYLHDLVLIGFLLVNLRRLKLFRPILWFALAAFVSLVMAAFKLPFNKILTAALYLLRFLAYSLLIDLKIDRRWLLIFSSGVALLGLAQYFFVPDTRFLAGLNWDDHYYRLLSTLLDPNFTGIILVLGLVLIYLSRPVSKRLLGLHFLALLLTYSRSSYLALVAAALYLAWLKKKLQWFVLGLAILALALVLLPRPGGEGVKLERVLSGQQRLTNYRLGIDLWRQSPVFGLGFNTLKYYRDNPLSHSAGGLDSSLLFVLATTGIVGLLAYLNLLRCLWKKSLLLRVSLVALLVHSLFVNSLFYSFAMIWLFSLASLDKAKSSGKL